MADKKSTCLIIDQMHLSIIPMLEQIGVQVTYEPEIAPEAVKERLQEGFEGLVLRSKLKVTKELIADVPQLRYIARAGAGIDNVDEQTLKERGITLLNAPEGNRDAVGEFTLGLLLGLLRNISRSHAEVKQYIWQREANRGEELSGKTVAIIGYGNMGRAFARRLSAFGCSVLACDKKKTIQMDGYAKAATIEQIQEQADVLSLHIPFTADNRHFANEQFLSGFRKSFWLLNTSRGEVLDQEALVMLLKSGKVKGAALDVLENEKLKTLTPEQKLNFDYLAQSPQVILTPHIAGWTHESYLKINQTLVDKIRVLLA